MTTFRRHRCPHSTRTPKQPGVTRYSCLAGIRAAWAATRSHSAAKAERLSPRRPVESSRVAQGTAVRGPCIECARSHPAVTRLEYREQAEGQESKGHGRQKKPCLLYTSDAADEEDSVDLGGRRIIKK